MKNHSNVGDACANEPFDLNDNKKFRIGGLGKEKLQEACPCTRIAEIMRGTVSDAFANEPFDLNDNIKFRIGGLELL